MKIPQIVLTGGPCAGKTTGLNFVAEKLRDWGWRVLIVPEAATFLFGGGIPDIAEIARTDPRSHTEIQRTLLLIQRDLRRHYEDLERIFDPAKTVLLFDRGEMDAAAYMPPERFESILQEEHLTVTDIRDRYTAVLHLVTAANGAEEYYTLANNAARYETPEEARAVDKRLQRAWTGHPHLRVIDNSTDFECKMGRLLRSVTRVLGIPVPLEIERKFLLRRAPDFSIAELAHAQPIEIEQHYLHTSENQQTRIRRRSQHGASLYYKTLKIRKNPRVRVEHEAEIRPVDYIELSRERDPATGIIRKQRVCFLYKNQYFELDLFRDIPLALLEIELTEENDAIDLPPFLDVDREVTDDPAFSNAEIAKRIPPP